MAENEQSQKSAHSSSLERRLFTFWHSVGFILASAVREGGLSFVVTFWSLCKESRMSRAEHA